MAQPVHRFITRRHLVAGSAAVIPAVAAFPLSTDPVFAAIAEHQRAYTELVALIEQQAVADRALQATEAASRPALEARLNALCEAEGPLGLLEMQASARLAATVPATLDGALAALRYVRTLFERDAYPLYEGEGYRALLRSTERAIERGRAGM